MCRARRKIVRKQFTNVQDASMFARRFVTIAPEPLFVRNKYLYMIVASP